MMLGNEIDIVPAIAPENFRKLPCWKLGCLGLVCVPILVSCVVGSCSGYCVVFEMSWWLMT